MASESSNAETQDSPEPSANSGSGTPGGGMPSGMPSIMPGGLPGGMPAVLSPALLQSEQFEELLTCAVCLDRYNKPKLLPCQHTFCQEPCMEGLVNWLYRKLDCPECRAEHRVPIGGVQNFPNNLTIISFLDLTARAAGLTPQPPPPQPMSHLDYLKPRLPPQQEINVGTGEARISASGRQSESEFTHSAVTSLSPPTPQLIPCPLCETLQPELVHCSHCQRRICGTCKDSHVEVIKGDIGRVVHQIRRGFIRLEDAVKGWESKEEQLKTNLDASKSEINDVFVKYQQELENRRDIMNTEVEMFGTSEGRRISTQKEQVQTVLQQMTSFCDNTETQLTEGNLMSDSELMNLKHQCGLNMNSLRAYGPENIDSKRIRFKAETRHLNAAIVVFGQVIETGTGSHASHLTSRGSPSDSPDSPRTNRPFTSRFLTAERERAAAAAAAAAADGSGASSPDASPAARRAAASTTSAATSNTSAAASTTSTAASTTSAAASTTSAAASTTSTAASTTSTTSAAASTAAAEDSSSVNLARSNTFHFGGQGRRLGGSPTSSLTNSPTSDVTARRLAALTGSGSAAGSGNASGSENVNDASSGSEMDGSTGVNSALDRSISSPAGVYRSESADRDANGNGVAIDFISREVSPDDTESVTSRIMRRLNTMGLGFEEVAAFSSGRSAGRAHQVTPATTSETQFTNYLTKSTTRFKFGRRGADTGCFTWPRGIAVNEEGEIIVADSSNHRIQVFDGHGEFLRQFGRYGQSDAEFDCLAGVCVNKANGQIVIADRYNHRIQIFTSQGGWIRSFGEEGYWDGQMSYPWGVACAPDGNIFVCDKENHRVQVFHPNGTFMYSFGRLGCDDGCFENPHYVAVSEDGNRVVVSDSGNHRIQIFSPTGQHEMTIGREGTLNGQFKYPRGVLFDREGFILVGDSGNNRVQVFRPDGTFYTAFLTWGSSEGEVKGIEGLALTQDGGVVVCDRENHRIQVA